MSVCVVLSCLLFVALWSPAGKGLVFVVFCHFPKCVLVHSRIKGEVGAVKLAYRTFVDHLCFCCLCLLCLCGRLFIWCWERADLLALVCGV